MAIPKKLILVRHGAYRGSDSNPDLSTEGKMQARRLAEIIKSEVGLEECVIWSSPANRAFETARVIAQQLGIPQSNIEQHEKLWSDDRYSHDFAWLSAKLDAHSSHSSNTVIIVSHLEYVFDFQRRMLDLPVDFPSYAEGFVISESRARKISGSHLCAVK